MSLGVLSRFISHTPNFTPVIAIALFGGVYLRRWQALLLPLGLMMATDALIGFHSVVAFTWGSVLIISCIGLWTRKSPTFGKVLLASLVSAVLFFVVTNFGAWLAFYPQTWEGFVACYTLAIPFFRGTLVSTLLYSALMFGGYELLAVRIKTSRLAPVLLNK
jgi:hypothetical protein